MGYSYIIRHKYIYRKCPIRRPRPNKRPLLFFRLPNPSHTVKVQRQRLFRTYFKVTVSILCIFFDNYTHNISLEVYLFIKVIVMWCVHCLEGQRWLSEHSNKMSFFKLYFKVTISTLCIFMTVLLKL